MTVDDNPFSHDFLGETAERIINERPGINRVIYDITSSTPGTINENKARVPKPLEQGLWDARHAVATSAL